MFMPEEFSARDMATVKLVTITITVTVIVTVMITVMITVTDTDTTTDTTMNTTTKIVKKDTVILRSLNLSTPMQALITISTRKGETSTLMRLSYIFWETY